MQNMSDDINASKHFKGFILCFKFHNELKEADIVPVHK